MDVMGHVLFVCRQYVSSRIVLILLSLLMARFPASLRAKGYALSNVISMAAGFAAQYTGLPMFTVMERWTWIFFGFCMFFAFLIALFTFPYKSPHLLP